MTKLFAIELYKAAWYIEEHCISRFVFENGIRVLIAPVPGHCILVTSRMAPT